MREEIYALARTLSGERLEERVLYAACDAAIAVFKARLRKGILPEDCGESFTCACAWMAIALCDSFDGGEVTAFQMADISIQKSGSKAAQALLLQAETLMAPWCSASGFAFIGVRG